MKIAMVREFLDNASAMLAPKIRSWPHAGKREIFSALSDDMRRQIDKRGITEEEIVADFESWRKSKRETRRRR